MAGMLEYLMGPQENQLARIGGAMSSGFDAFQGEQDRQTAAAEKRRLLAKEEAAAKLAAEERRIKTAESDVERRQKLASQYIGAGNNDMAMKVYNGAGGSLEALNLPFQQMVGGLRSLTNEQAAAVPGKVEDLFSYDAQGNFRPAVQDAMNPQSLAMLQGFSGYTPKVEQRNPYEDTYINGQLVTKALPKPPQFQLGGNGGLVFNPQTGDTRQTGYVQPITPYQRESLDVRKQNQSEIARLRAAAAKVTDARQMAKIQLQVKQYADKTATDPDTGIVDSEKSKLNEEQLMLELNLINETEQAKRKAKQNEAQAGNATKAGQEATAGIKRLVGGDAQLAAWAKHWPNEYEQMRAYLADRAMGKPVGRAPFEASAIRNMVNGAMNNERTGRPSPAVAPTAPARPTLGQAIAAPFQRTPQQTQNATDAMKRLNQYLPQSMQFEVE